MPLPCHCVDIRKYDFRGDYTTDHQLKRTIDTLVGETLVAAAAEDVTERVLHEALLKAKGGSYTKRFTMTSKKPPAAKSDDETAIDSETSTVPQGDTPLSPELIKMVSALSTIDEENPAICSEKESLEEETKRMISIISAFEFEPSPGKNVTEGNGDAKVVETAPTGMEEICESQSVPDLLLYKASSKERLFQENKDDIAAWEEAVEIVVQIIGPTYDDENTSVYYRETASPYTSSMESISDPELMKENICSHFPATNGEIGSNELKHGTHEDDLLKKSDSDEYELETLAICTSIVIEVMATVEETLSEIEANTDHHQEVNVTQALNTSQIMENDKHGEINKDISASKEILTEVEETTTIVPVINTIKSSMEPIYGLYKEESEEEDMYDIESINVHSVDILEHNAHHKSAVLSDSLQNTGRDHELETYKKAEEITAGEHTFKDTTETTAPLPSFQSSVGETMALTATAAHQEPCTPNTEVDTTISMKEKEFFGECKEYLKTEHLEPFTAPINIHYNMGNKVQNCDDIFVRAAEPQLLDNTAERRKMSPAASARSLDSLSEADYKNKELEKIKYRSEQRGNLNSSINMERNSSPILKHKDEVENVPVIQNEGTEDRPPTSTSIALKCIDELLETLDVHVPQSNQNTTENYSAAVVPLEKQEIKITDASALGDNITDVFTSISTIIKDGLEPTEKAKMEEEQCTRTKSSQNLMETTVHSVQEDKQDDERPENYLETAFISSQENKSVPYCPRESSNITKLQVSQRKTKTGNLQKPSSTRDAGSAKKKKDIDPNLCSRKKPTPGEAANGKVHKTRKFGSYTKRFTMTSKKPPAAKSDDETAVDSETSKVSQGDTPLSPELMKMVSTLSTIDEEHPAICSGKESLEEEIKKMISRISAFEFELSPRKNVAEGKGDAEVVETAPTGKEDICESQAVPDLLLYKASSKEQIFQENKDDIAAWEEAVEIEIQVIDPTYDDENPSVYYRETVSPYTSSMESISDPELMKENICSHFPATNGEIGSNELKHCTHEDDLFTKTDSDEYELEALAICTSIVIEVMARVEETISETEENTHHHQEVNVTQALNTSQIMENDKHGEINKDISASKEILTEVEETNTIVPVINTIKSSIEPIYGQYKEESEEEDMYDIESINIHSVDILEHNAHHKSAVLSDSLQNTGRDHELETYKKAEEITASENTFKDTTETTAPLLSFQSLIGEPMAVTATVAHQEPCTPNTKVDTTISMKEKEFFGECKEYLKAEHLEPFTAPINIHYNMGNKVQNCDDIFVRAAEPQLLDNTAERRKMSPAASARSLDSLSEANYKNKELEKKYQSEQIGNLNSSINMERNSSPTLKHKDEEENVPVIQNEEREDKPCTSTSTALKCTDELLETSDVHVPQSNQNTTENYTEAPVPLEMKEIKITDASALEDNITDVFTSISTIIKDGLEPTEKAKMEEEQCTRTKSSQNLMETTVHSVQEDKQDDERPENYLKTAFISSQENKSVPYCPRESSNITKLQVSQRKTKTGNLQKPSSTRDEGSAKKKKKDIDPNLCSRKKLTPGEAANGKVHKTRKFGNKIKKLLSSLMHKN